MSWLFSQALVAEYSEDMDLDGAPCALLNGTPTQLPSWCNDKTIKRCQLSRCGTTFKPLTVDNGEAVLMSFLEDFPVRTSVVPGGEQASTGSDHPCGCTWQESLVKFDLNSSSWKTHQCLWEEDLRESSVILPRWGMMQNGECWERITLAHLTNGTESGLLGSWATPRSSSAMAANLSESLAARCADHNNLEEQVSLTIWPMPTCQEVEHPDAEPTNTGRRLSKDGKSSHSLNLADSVKNWPTPATRDYKGVSGKGRQKRKGNPADTLPNAIAQYPTVTANENASGTPAGNMQKMLGNDPRVRGETPEQWSKGALNPTWVEWLMGWPIGWTLGDIHKYLNNLGRINARPADIEKQKQGIKTEQAWSVGVRGPH